MRSAQQLRTCLLSCALVILGPLFAVAGDPVETLPSWWIHDLTGIWYRVVAGDTASEGGVTGVVVRNEPGGFVMSLGGGWVPRLVPPDQFPGIPETDTTTAFPVRLRRSGWNRYEATSFAHFGQSGAPEPPRTVWAMVCNGDARQLADDLLVIDWYCYASCNPCYPGCWSQGLMTCDPGRLWDPFGDPTAICPGEVFHTEFRKVPIDRGCVPE